MNGWLIVLLVAGLLFVLLVWLEEHRRIGSELARPISYRSRTGLPWGEE